MKESPLGLISSDGKLVLFADIQQSQVDGAGKITRIAELESENADLKAKIAALMQQLSPAIHEILPAIEAVGLTAWAGDAVTAAEDTATAMALVINLRQIAAEPPSWSQCDRIKQDFGLLCQMSKVVPTPEQAAAMQAILDTGCPSTGPVHNDKLNFHQWM